MSGLEDRCNAVCIGHALFGLYPFPIELACTQELLPVIAQLSSQLIQVTQHGQGADLAIANEFGLDRDRIIGVLPVGLAHGISRPAPGKTCEVLVRGRRIPVLAVSLEHTTVDLTRCPDAEVADTVILLGHSEDASIKLEEYARWRNELFARELDASVWARTRSLPVVVLSYLTLESAFHSAGVDTQGLGCHQAFIEFFLRPSRLICCASKASGKAAASSTSQSHNGVRFRSRRNHKRCVHD